MAIGAKLTDLMKIRGTNANELAQAVNVAPTTIYSLIKRDGKKTTCSRDGDLVCSVHLYGHGLYGCTGGTVVQ